MQLHTAEGEIKPETEAASAAYRLGSVGQRFIPFLFDNFTKCDITATMHPPRPPTTPISSVDSQPFGCQRLFALIAPAADQGLRRFLLSPTSDRWRFGSSAVVTTAVHCASLSAIHPHALRSAAALISDGYRKLQHARGVFQPHKKPYGESVAWQIIGAHCRFPNARNQVSRA